MNATIDNYLAAGENFVLKVMKNRYFLSYNKQDYSMKSKFFYQILICFLLTTGNLSGQIKETKSKLTLDRIFNSNDFQQVYPEQLTWIENGNSYVTTETTGSSKGINELVKYISRTGERSVLIGAESLITENGPVLIESFSFSDDGSKVLLYANSKRVWRSNSKGDYWIYDLKEKNLKKAGSSFPASSLMFAKFSKNNQLLAYVHKFNLYIENVETGEVKQLTFDGNEKVINGTFDWVYEEEFGMRDGFRWSPDGDKIAFWHLDATKTRDFYMINNTDSTYSRIIPVPYPKVGEKPSGVKVGIISLSGNTIIWVRLEGSPDDYYIPGLRWVDNDMLLVEQVNRKQNHLNIYSFKPSTGSLKNIYSESSDTWIDVKYPDVTASNWSQDDLFMTDRNQSFLRMTETDAWRHIYKINITSGKKTLLTPGDYDVASICAVTVKDLYFIASPSNSTQRYLFRTGLEGKGKPERVTPESFPGINRYSISPDGMYANHIYSSHSEPSSSNLITLPNHKTLRNLTDNEEYKKELSSLELPEVKFMKVNTEDGIEMDVKMIYPVNFNPEIKYPVIFYVYGEPWGQVAVDDPLELWEIMLAQQGYFYIAMDNRGTPCLKGTEWRKSIYKKVGVINARDQAMGAKELLKLPYLDSERTAVWGWSGGGSMTLNLMFRYPDIYKTGIAVAAVPNQLLYDNIYQERYMGLPSENREAFLEGSPVTYAKNLKGNLLMIHGTGDDNVHYQGFELLVNELVKTNRQFQMMAYPNRSHSIYEGPGTRLHLYTLMTNYFLRNNPPVR